MEIMIVCLLDWTVGYDLCNDQWRIAFPNAIVKTLPQVDFSDHHPILICLHVVEEVRRERPFRFESAWLTHTYFNKDLKLWWQYGVGLTNKLAQLESELRIWKTNTFCCVRVKKKNLVSRLVVFRRSTKKAP